METIYSQYTGRPSFESTLSLIERLIASRLLPGYKRVWVQGTNSGRSTILFTIFDENNSYRMVFLPIGIRQYQPEGNIENEIRLMEELILRFRNGPLNGIIS